MVARRACGEADQAARLLQRVTRRRDGDQMDGGRCAGALARSLSACHARQLISRCGRGSMRGGVAWRGLGRPGGEGRGGSDRDPVPTPDRPHLVLLEARQASPSRGVGAREERGEGRTSACASHLRHPSSSRRRGIASHPHRSAGVKNWLRCVEQRDRISSSPHHTSSNGTPHGHTTQRLDRYSSSHHLLHAVCLTRILKVFLPSSLGP